MLKQKTYKFNLTAVRYTYSSMKDKNNVMYKQGTKQYYI